MAKKIAVDNRFAHIAQKRWGETYEIVPSQTVPRLSEPVCAHPDMVLVRVGDVYIAEKTVYDYYKTRLQGETVICGETMLSGNYPADIAYNVLISEHKAFANLPYIDTVLKQELLHQGIELIHVNQGYAKCSCTLAGKCMITADPAIYKAATNHGFSVLQISPGDVVLDGFDYGFIGGASGFFDETLFFFGDITKHCDFAKIKAFLAENRVEWDYIPDYPLTDVGTLIGI